MLLQTLKINFFLLFNIKEFKNFVNHFSFFLKVFNLNILLYILNHVSNNDNVVSSDNNYLSLLIYKISDILVFRVSIKFFCIIIYFDKNFIFSSAV